MARLREYEALLLKWNPIINLVSRGSLNDAWERHFMDSLQLVRLLPATTAAGVDMGSGAGFPGLVVAIASGIHFSLIEADRRKAAFLNTVIAATGAPARVYAQRIEQVAIGPADILTARALAPLTRLLSMGARLLKPDGKGLFLKGNQAAGEIAAASASWHMRVVQHHSAASFGGVILEIDDLSPRGG